MLPAKTLVASFFVLSLTSSALAQVEPAAIEDFLEQARRETGAPGISAAVALGGALAYSGGVGYAELENLTPADATIVHNVGSVSKVLATVAVMQLVERGQVGLEDPIQKYVPSFPEKQAPITVRHILTHTSGIRHYKQGEFGEQNVGEMRRYAGIEQAIGHFSGDPLLFEPGTLWSYSSHAFNLLQGVVEKASGLGFEEYMRLNVWEPAGMLRSSFDVPERVVYKRGRGYERDENGILVNTRYVDPSYKYAGGGMLSTAEDLLRFALALNDGELLGPETRALMYTVQVDPVLRYRTDGEPAKESFRQALGWRIDTDAQGRSYINHTGTVKGARSYLLNYPEEGLVVALQANIDPFDIRKYGNAIAQMFLRPVSATN